MGDRAFGCANLMEDASACTTSTLACEKVGSGYPNKIQCRDL